MKLQENPWEVFAVDLKGPFLTGEHLLELIDYRSRYPVIAKLKETSTTTIISPLTKIFTIFGVLKVITADNGKQFQSREFRNYNSQYYIRARYVTPHWSLVNAEV